MPSATGATISILPARVACGAFQRSDARTPLTNPRASIPDLERFSQILDHHADYPKVWFHPSLEFLSVDGWFDLEGMIRYYEELDAGHALDGLFTAHTLDHLAWLKRFDERIMAVLESGWGEVLETRLPKPAGYVSHRSRIWILHPSIL
jgi:hypothetical protein